MAISCQSARREGYAESRAEAPYETGNLLVAVNAPFGALGKEKADDLTFKECVAW
jgi:hypothetical protein